MAELLPRFQTVLGYVAETMPDDSVFDWILRETPRRGIPEIAITSVQGQLLRQLAKLTQARRIVEIGTLSGYSTVWMAKGLSPDGEMITIEVNPTHAEMARESLDRAGLGDRARVLVGPALDVLAGLDLHGPCDLVFIDADKQNDLAYFQWGMEHTRAGGLVVVDNVFMNGSVVTRQDSPPIAAIREMNEYVAANYAEWASFVPAYKEEEDNVDGFLIVQVPWD